MKVKVEKQELARVLEKIQRIVKRRTKLSVTDQIVITAGEDEVIIHASDLETSYRTAISAEVASPGEVCLPGERLYAIVREYPHEWIVIDEQEDRWITIGGDLSISYTLLGRSSTDFLVFPEIPDGDKFPVTSRELRESIKKCCVISGGADARAYIQGIRVSVSDDMLTLASTDSARLIECRSMACAASYDPAQLGSVIAPKTGLEALADGLFDGGISEISVTDRFLIVRQNEEIWAITLLECDFPEYATLLSEAAERPCYFRAERDKLIEDLRRVAILIEKETSSIKIDGGNEVFVTARNPSVGDARVYPTVEYFGAPCEASINVRFLIDAVRSVNDSNVRVTMDERKAWHIAGCDNSGVQSIVMPVKQ